MRVRIRVRVRVIGLEGERAGEGRRRATSEGVCSGFSQGDWV